jgi:hypothetical protein
MKTHSREKKVLVILCFSIALGTIILNALGHNPPSAGAFCLSRYYLLGSVNKAIGCHSGQSQEHWSQIEIDYSGTESGNIDELASLSKPDSSRDVDYHFIICNGKGGHDGLIQPTEKWQKQSPIIQEQERDGEQAFCETPAGQTIYICVIADNETSFPTNFQIKRLEELVEGLCRKFNIRPQDITYPDRWQ